VCSDATTQCEVCSDIAYKSLGNTCVDKCSSNYKRDTTNRICEGNEGPSIAQASPDSADTSDALTPDDALVDLLLLGLKIDPEKARGCMYDNYWHSPF